MADEIRVDTGKSEITLDQLGALQPGMARLMAEISPRIGTCYHAAAAGNWGLARYMLSSAVKIMEAAMVLRPKYRKTMTSFIARECGAVRTAIERQDIEAFRLAFDAMTKAANTFHEHYGHPYIRWRVPSTGPAYLDLTPDE